MIKHSQVHKVNYVFQKKYTKVQTTISSLNYTKWMILIDLELIFQLSTAINCWVTNSGWIILTCQKRIKIPIESAEQI